MSSDPLDYQRRAVRPMQCLREGWQLIKDDYWLFFGITLVGMLLGSLVPLGILLGPMLCGIEICLLRRMRGQRASFNDLFEGFNYFGPSVVATLCMMVPILVLFVVLYLLLVVGFVALLIPQLQQAQQGGAPPGPEIIGIIFGLMGGYTIAIIVGSAAIGAPFIFTYQLIVDRKLSGFAAIITSFKAAFGNFVGVFGLVFLLSLLNLAGSLICVGAYLLMPLLFAAYTIAYRQVFPLQPALTDDWPDEDDAIHEPPMTGITEL